MIELNEEELREIGLALYFSREKYTSILQYQGVPLKNFEQLPDRLRLIDSICSKLGIKIPEITYESPCK